MAEIFRQERSAQALFEADDARVARLHRYYLARQFAAGCDVLDLRAGDGSGAALLAQVARGVVATVIDVVTAEAARADFPAATLSFRSEDEAAGAETDSADLIVAFGVLARAADAQDCVARLRQALRQGGRIVLDAPERGTAPGSARQAFTAGEFAALLEEEFAHVRIFGQRGLIGSAMLGERGGVRTVFAHRDRLHVEVSRGLNRVDALVAVVSESPLDNVSDSLFIDAGLSALAEAQVRAAQAQSEAQTLRGQNAELAAQSHERRRSDAEWRHQLAVLRVSEAAAVKRAADLAAQREALMLDAVAAGARAEALRAECERLRAQPAPPPAPPAGTGIIGRLARYLPRGSARVNAIRRSALFDPAWYLTTYPDVRAAGADPAAHYLRNGDREHRNPGPDFDGAWYQQQHPDSAASGLTALEHFERHGRAAGWACQPERAVVVERAPNPKILFVAGEPDTPGAQYRCARMAQAARDAGWSAGWSRIEQTGAIELIGVEVVILWRVSYSKHVEGVMAEVRRGGGIVVFDVDDLMIRPELARTSIIDGLRTTNAAVGPTREFFTQVQQAMIHADLCSTTTEELAAHMRAWQKAAYILPNGYDEETLARSRLAVRKRALSTHDGFIRIGYAAGTVTHQKDFAVALPGILRVLQTRPQVLLVLFRAKNGPDLVMIDEFESLTPYADRIEWRDKVDLEGLPAELARFDINIAPLELGNPFCEAKSDLKYFEAALVSVPTVATPTGPFARSLRDGVTGLLAANDDDWQTALLRLIDNAELRYRIGRAAYLDCIFPYGPQRRAEQVESFLRQITGGVAGAQAAALDMLQRADHLRRGVEQISLPPAQLLYRTDRMQRADVTVVVPCYNYAEFIIEALESVRGQSLDLLDLVIVDDCSSELLTLDLILEWVKTHDARFNRIIVLRHGENAGLSTARNTGFEAAETPYILPLDADNRLRPTCCDTLLAHIRVSRAAYAYPSLQMFGAADSVFCNERYQAARFVGGNYIDAMAMIGKWAWAAAGGYSMPRAMGWEDFDLWCRLAELGQHGIHVNDILAEYRVHGSSMVATLVETDETKEKMVKELEHRHTWLKLSSRVPHSRV